MENKIYGVKLLMDTSVNPCYNYEIVLEAVSCKISPEAVYYINFDSEFAVYLLHVRSIEDMCKLLQEGIEIYKMKIPVCPLFDAFIVSGVYPFIKNSVLCELFNKFGNVSRISDVYVSPNVDTFSHIKSGLRQVEMLTPGRDESVCVPSIITAVIEGFSVLFVIRKLCYVCMNVGHDTLKCSKLIKGTPIDYKCTDLVTYNAITISDDQKYVTKDSVTADEKVFMQAVKSDAHIRRIVCSSGKCESKILEPFEKLTAIPSSALCSNDDTSVVTDNHSSKVFCSNNDELKNIDIHRGKKRKYSSMCSSLPSIQNSSEGGNATSLSSGNEIINIPPSLNVMNSTLPLVSDHLNTYNYMQIKKWEGELKGVNCTSDNHQQQLSAGEHCDSIAETAVNKVSPSMLLEVSENIIVDEIHIELGSELGAEPVASLNTVPIHVNENYENLKPFEKLNAISSIPLQLNNDTSINDHELSLKESCDGIDELENTDTHNMEERKHSKISSLANIQNSSQVINARPSEYVNEITEMAPLVNAIDHTLPSVSLCLKNHNFIQTKKSDPEINYGDQLGNVDPIGSNHQLELCNNKCLDPITGNTINKVSRRDSDESSTCSSSSLPAIEEMCNFFEKLNE